MFENDMDYLTFIGDGEPLLNSSIGWLISKVRKEFGRNVRIAVWSNGSLLSSHDVREEILEADVVKVTIDAGNDPTYRAINRPHPGLSIDNVISGIAAFRDMFKGKLWVEVMLVKGVNDSVSELESIGTAISAIHADKVHITVPTRPPTEPWVKPPDNSALTEALKILSKYAHDVEVLPWYEGDEFIINKYEDLVEGLLAIIKVHPMRKEQVTKVALRAGRDPSEIIKELLLRPYVTLVKYGNHEYLTMRKNRNSST